PDLQPTLPGPEKVRIQMLTRRFRNTLALQKAQKSPDSGAGPPDAEVAAIVSSPPRRSRPGGSRISPAPNQSRGSSPVPNQLELGAAASSARHRDLETEADRWPNDPATN